MIVKKIPNLSKYFLDLAKQKLEKGDEEQE